MGKEKNNKSKTQEKKKYKELARKLNLSIDLLYGVLGRVRRKLAADDVGFCLNM